MLNGVSDHLRVERFDELELVGFDEEAEGDVVEARVGFDGEVAFHEVDEGVDFGVQFGVGVGFEEDEEGGLVDGELGGVHLAEEGEH